MRLRKSTWIPATLICAVLFWAPSAVLAQDGQDSGTAMVQLLEMKWQELANGQRLGHETTRAFVVTENAESPLHNAAVLCRNTHVYAAGAERMDFEVNLCEAQDAAGNLTWLVSNPEGSLSFIRGTGKFEGITGSVKVVGGIQRQDDVHAAKLEISWKVEK